MYVKSMQIGNRQVYNIVYVSFKISFIIYSLIQFVMTLISAPGVVILCDSKPVSLPKTFYLFISDGIQHGKGYKKKNKI